MVSVVDLPGTENPTAGSSIYRQNERDTSDTSPDYFVSGPVEVLDDGDSIRVSGIPFDGNDIYDRDPGGLGAFAFYRNAVDEVFDAYDINGDPITQSENIAIHADSENGLVYVTLFARADLETSGFVYGRNGGVSIPPRLLEDDFGQANYSGDYMALRRFTDDDQPVAGLQFVFADMSMEIDFREVNSPGALRFDITNRRLLDENGVQIGTLAAIGGIAENWALDAQGEFQATGSATDEGSPVAVYNSDTDAYEPSLVNDEQVYLSQGSGDISGLIAGSNAESIAGTLTLEDGGNVIGTVDIDGTTYVVLDPNIKVTETGAFVLDR